MTVWPLLAIGAAALQVLRNAAQRSLTERLGLWGATYIRFIYGLPFALAWSLVILFLYGPSGAPSWAFLGWIFVGATTQIAGTAALVVAMRTRAFAVTTALLKTEVLGSAVVGMVLIGDRLSAGDWLGACVGTAGVLLMAHVSVDRNALGAAFAGAGAGILFAFTAVGYRAAALSWGGEPWIGAAAALSATLALQTLMGGVFMYVHARTALWEVLAAWRPSLTPGGAGAISSALLLTAFATGPSVAAVKTVQLVDVLIAWAVSRHMFREPVAPWEIAGAALVVLGATAVLL
jgi:drug/metabolite transporter (DMT)-like permease